MKIIYDHQIFAKQKFGGISRYFFELITNSNNSKLVSFYSENEYSKRNVFLNKFGKFFLKKFIPLLNEIYALFAVKFLNYDIFHPTYYDTYYLKFAPQNKIVITCFDLIYEKFSEKYKINERLFSTRKKVLNNAKLIIAISENTKQDLIDIYHISPEKIRVIHLATNFTDLVSCKPQISLPTKYLLFVGNRHSYKNFDFLISALSDILQKQPDLNLVCAGSTDFSQKELDFLNQNKINTQVKHVKFRNDNELKYLYENAICFIFPSVYEGFGIPILEAFASNCACLISNSSSFPEIAKDAALYFDPNNSKDLQECIYKVLNDKDFVEDLKVKGSRQVANFSWKKTTQLHQEVYKEISSTI